MMMRQPLQKNPQLLMIQLLYKLRKHNRLLRLKPQQSKLLLKMHQLLRKPLLPIHLKLLKLQRLHQLKLLQQQRKPLEQQLMNRRHWMKLPNTQILTVFQELKLSSQNFKQIWKLT
jgi:hypothetical protein